MVETKVLFVRIFWLISVDFDEAVEKNRSLDRPKVTARVIGTSIGG